MNLQIQEATLSVQKDLQVELVRQFELQKRLQSEMERLQQEYLRAEAAHAAHDGVDESALACWTATASRMNSLLPMKQKLQQELMAHLKMQREFLTQLHEATRSSVIGTVAHTDAIERGAAAPAAKPHQSDATVPEEEESPTDVCSVNLLVGQWQRVARAEPGSGGEGQPSPPPAPPQPPLGGDGRLLR